MSKTAEQSMLPVYLVSGADALKRERVLKRLHSRMEQFGDLSFNYDHFNGEEAAGGDIVAACNTLPFASELRLVQVDNAEKLRKADSEALVAYLGAPCESSVLCLVCESLAKNTRLYKAVAKMGKQSVIDCTPLKRKELPNHVRNMAPAHGITITPAAAEKLVELVGEDTVALDAQLQKLALAQRGNDPVGDAQVAALVSRTAEAKPWEFVDAFSQRNVKKCLLLQARMDKASPFALLGMCTTRIRELITAKSLETRGQGSALAAALKQPDWRVKNHRMWARGFSSEELRGALLSARDAEAAMKSGTDPQQAFNSWYLSVIAR